MHLQSAATVDHVTLIRGYPSHLAYNRFLLFIIWKQGWLWKFVFKILSIKKDDNSELYKHISSQIIPSYRTSFICFWFRHILNLLNDSRIVFDSDWAEKTPILFVFWVPPEWSEIVKANNPHNISLTRHWGRRKCEGFSEITWCSCIIACQESFCKMDGLVQILEHIKPPFNYR